MPTFRWAGLWLTPRWAGPGIPPKSASLVVGAPTLGASTVESEVLLREIAGYCRRVGMAESTFGRLAVNDGKLVSRLRFGGRVKLGTVERVHSFIEQHQPSARRTNGGNGEH